MKKISVFFTMVLFVALSFTSCSKDDDGEKADPNNPYVGTWVKDGSDGDVVVVFTNTAWTAKYQNNTYNSGSYTWEWIDEDNANAYGEWTITNEGIGDAKKGDKGNAVIDSGKLFVSNFNDGNMNGSYTKQ